MKWNLLGSGKRIGWGSALPILNSSSNIQAADTECSETLNNDAKQPLLNNINNNRPKINPHEQHYPPLPPTAVAAESNNKNIP